MADVLKKGKLYQRPWVWSVIRVDFKRRNERLSFKLQKYGFKRKRNLERSFAKFYRNHFVWSNDQGT